MSINKINNMYWFDLKFGLLRHITPSLPPSMLKENPLLSEIVKNEKKSNYFYDSVIFLPSKRGAGGEGKRWIHSG